MEVHIQDVIAKLAAIKEERGNILVVFAVDKDHRRSYVNPFFTIVKLPEGTKVVIMP
jgi:hypothetical protein